MRPATPILLFLFCSFIAAAQNPLVKQWDYRYGGNNTEFLASFQQTMDGGYILGGLSASDSTGDRTQGTRGGEDFWIVKTDSLGIKQWDKRFGGSNSDNINSLQQTTDGGYMLGGLTWSDSSGDVTQHTRGVFDYWMVKTDSLGNKQWDKRFGGASDDYLLCIRQTGDGGYISGGYSISDSTGDKTQPSRGGIDYWVVKTDSLGNKLWDKRFGGTGVDRLYSLQQTSDGGYILGGYSTSDTSEDKTQASRGFADYWVVKIDLYGNKLWDKRYGGADDDKLYSLQQTTDGGFILGGISASGIGGDKTAPMSDTGTQYGPNDFWLVKIDSAGNKQWDKKFGGLDTEDEYGSVQQTADGGYLLAGTSYSGIISGDKTEANLSREQSWVVKTDILGNKQWDKTLRTANISLTIDDELGLAIQTREGFYVMANFTTGIVAGDKTQASWNSSWDYWFIKFCDTSANCNLSSPAISANQTTFCASDSAQICAPAGMAAYQWNTGATTNCINTSQAGNYYVTVSDNRGCTATSNHLAIAVYPSPPISISVNGDTLTAYHAVTYQWLLNGNEIAGATDSVYIVPQAGLYSVAVIDSNGCSATCNPVSFTGFAEADMAYSPISVYPNPASDRLFIQANGEPVNEINIYNTTGQLVMTVKNQLAASSYQLSIATFAAGIYVAEIKTTGAAIKKRWVKL
jgi:hypothetical protein